MASGASLRASVAEQEELKWKAAARALHNQQEAYLRILQRTAGLHPLRLTSSADTLRSDHSLALEAALIESREAHAATLRQAREREIALENQLSEQAAALREHARKLEAVEADAQTALDMALRCAAAERASFALEMRRVEVEAISWKIEQEGLRAAVERRILADDFIAVENTWTAPEPVEPDIDFEVAHAEAVRSLEAAFKSLRKQAEAKESDERGRAILERQRIRTVELANTLFKMAAIGDDDCDTSPVPRFSRRPSADIAGDATVHDEVGLAPATYACSRPRSADSSGASGTNACVNHDATEQQRERGAPGKVRVATQLSQPNMRAARQAAAKPSHEAAELRELRLKYEELKSRHLRQIMREAELLKKGPRSPDTSPGFRAVVASGDSSLCGMSQALASTTSAWASPSAPRNPNPSSGPAGRLEETSDEIRRGRSPTRPRAVSRSLSPVSQAPAPPHYLAPTAASLRRVTEATSPSAMRRAPSKSRDPSPSKRASTQSRDVSPTKSASARSRGASPATRAPWRSGNASLAKRPVVLGCDASPTRSSPGMRRAGPAPSTSRRESSSREPSARGKEQACGIAVVSSSEAAGSESSRDGANLSLIHI